MSSPLPNQPTKYRGTQQPLVPSVTVNRAPTGADYRNPKTGKLYPVATIWQVGKNPTTGTEGDIWILAKIVANVAYWVQYSINQSTVTSLQGNDGLVTNPNAGVIEILGAMAANGTYSLPLYISKMGPSTEVATIQLSTATSLPNLNSSGVCHFDSSAFSVDSNGFVTLMGGSTGILSLTGDTGGAVSGTNIDLSSASTTYTIGNPGINNIKTEVVSTNHTILVGRGPTTASVALPALTNGQLLIGSTGNDPAAASLTAGTGITINNAPGAITISASVTGLPWQTITASQNLSVNTGYICTGGGALVLDLPSTSNVGDIIQITLDGSTSFKVGQAASQQIRLGSTQTTVGTLGSLTTNAQGDTLYLVCTVANLKWSVMSAMGNFTVV